jgi:hypothetical protein
MRVAGGGEVNGYGGKGPVGKGEGGTAEVGGKVCEMRRAVSVGHGV